MHLRKKKKNKIPKCSKCSETEMIEVKITDKNLPEILSKIVLPDDINEKLNKIPEDIRNFAFAFALKKGFNYYKCPKCDSFLLKKKTKLKGLM